MTALSPRLKLCADSVRGRAVCDVGTDHALLPVWLVENKYCDAACACDIAKGPLLRAAETVRAAGLENAISLVQSDGLKNVGADFSDVVIAGMGGETILSIISDESAKWLCNGARLILQPMTKADALRRGLCGAGFEIVEEKAVCEDRFIYTVIVAEYCGIKTPLSPVASIIGKLDITNGDGRKYADFQIKRLISVANGLKKAENLCMYTEFQKIAEKIFNGKDEKKMTIREIYDIINMLSPFDTQESFDNSGILVGSPDAEVTKILVCLDITNAVVDEASELGADLIVSHHPVIFKPLENIRTTNPVYKLISSSISAICVHTPLDMAENGINDMIYDMLREPLSLGEKQGYLEEIRSGLGYGSICCSSRAFSAQELAGTLKGVFGCPFVKYNDCKKEISTMAYCSGSGGSFIQAAAEAGADALITGDIKHSSWIEAQNLGLSVFDCGHYYTEIIALRILSQLLKNNTGLDIISSAKDTDIVRCL